MTHYLYKVLPGLSPSSGREPAPVSIPRTINMDLLKAKGDRRAFNHKPFGRSVSL